MTLDTVVVGAGYAGLTAAAYLAREGHRVTVLEQLPTPGGRNQRFVLDGFTFERGPSWLWMLDVHSSFYSDLGRKMSDYVQISRLDPAYRVFFPKDSTNTQSGICDVPNGVQEFAALLEKIEPGSSANFLKQMELDEFRYNQALETFIELPSVHIGEYVRPSFLKHLGKMGLFSNQRDSIAKVVLTPEARRLLEWPTIFVGHSPASVPSLYSLLNWAAIDGGTWFPTNGMYDTILGMERVCRELGVTFLYDHRVTGLKHERGAIKEVVCSSEEHGIRRFAAEKFLVTCDMAFFERSIVPKSLRMYSPDYWDSREVSPSCLLFYLGVDCRVQGLEHHNLFFDQSMYDHMDDIYGSTPQIPPNPLFYVSVISHSNRTLAPEGCDSIFVLVPMPSIPVKKVDKARILDNVLGRMEDRIDMSLRDHIVVQDSFDYSDFCKTYHSLGGNGFGLSNTLFQSAFLKPSMRSTTLSNLFYAGQTTAPGGGIPTSMLSGKIAARLAMGDAPTPSERALTWATQWMRSKL